MIQKLRDSGVQLKKIKEVIEYCKTNPVWEALGSDALRYVVTDGKNIAVRDKDGFLEDATGQRSFSFSIDLKQVQAEVFELLAPPDQARFSMDEPTQADLEEIYPWGLPAKAG